MSYSQNKEEQFISEYFGDFKGHLVDIGANDGSTFSNSRALIEKGWTADLYEPHPEAFKDLKRLYQHEDKVWAHNFAIGDHNGEDHFYINQPHIPGDVGLLSTLKKEEIKRWKDIEFDRINVNVKTWISASPLCNIDFVSIDAEGMDLEILKQIDLTDVMVVCIEGNGDYAEMLEHMEGYGMSEIHRNGENIICGK